jgi:predicted RNase H-like nuclease (RuvC/YqgF family)
MKRSSLSRRQHDEILAAIQRRHDAEIANLKADIERLRGERDQFEKDRDAITAAARRDVAKAQATIACLKEDLAAASPGGETTASLRRRIKNLQKQYDDAMGLNTSQVLEGAHWQETREDRGLRVMEQGAQS